MTAKEVLRQILDDGIMTEDKAIQLINNHALSIIEKAVRDEKKANMNALADSIGNNILTRVKQATFDKANK